MHIPLQFTRGIVRSYIYTTICIAEWSTDTFDENTPVLFSQLCPTDIMCLDKQTNTVNLSAGFPSIIFVYCKPRVTDIFLLALLYQLRVKCSKRLLSASLKCKIPNFTPVIENKKSQILQQKRFSTILLHLFYCFCYHLNDLPLKFMCSATLGYISSELEVYCDDNHRLFEQQWHVFGQKKPVKESMHQWHSRRPAHTLN